MITTLLQTPGIRFETVPPQPDEVLPRMDIAAFVGLSARGPIHTPVVVEDVARYRDIFGADMALAQDVHRGQIQYAQLGQAVEAFFRNGGLRCWVVRVADPQVETRFLLPDLVRVDNGEPAMARARCMGSWADNLRVGTVLAAEALQTAARVHFLDPDTAVAMLALNVYGPKIQEGDLLRLTYSESLIAFVDVQTSQKTDAIMQQITGRLYGFAVTPQDSPPDATSVWEQIAAASLPIDTIEPLAERLTLDLWVWQGQETAVNLSGLGFSEQHPAFWAHLPTDERLFALRDERGHAPQLSSLDALAMDPRFPLAGEANPASLYLPLGMSNMPDPQTTVQAQPLPDPATRLERDGIATFSAGLFLDAKVGNLAAEVLLEEANYHYFVRGNPLTGLHSLLPLDEVTLVAVPDAIHAGWQHVGTGLPAWLEPPHLSPPIITTNEVHLHWSTVAGATVYEVAVGTGVSFEGTRPVLNAVEVTTTDTALALPITTSCPRPLFYRVRARQKGIRGPWSNTQTRLVPTPDFELCDDPTLNAPQALTMLSDPAVTQDISLSWLPVIGATDYLWQSSADPDFQTAHSQTTSATDVTISLLPRVITYYRVRAHFAAPGNKSVQVSAWSNTVMFLPPPQSIWLNNSNYDAVDLLAIQQALLRFCRARADMVAIMAMPRHYRKAEALNHVALLTERGNGRLSYGALYHPWLAVRLENGSVRWTAPEGSVLGMTATRTIERGAWVAPANQPLLGVLALDPPINYAEWATWLTAQINVIQPDPRGFLLMSAETLSATEDVRPFNVRRLLILLRRIALREGANYVFEAHTAQFRRLIHFRFEHILADLYQRGAFVGDSAKQAYKVNTDRILNPRASIEQGRVFIELRVAPSQPLAYITVRLVQTGHEGIVFESQ